MKLSNKIMFITYINQDETAVKVCLIHVLTSAC